MKFSIPFFVITGLALASCSSSGTSGNVTIKGASSSSSAVKVLGAADPSYLKVKVYKFAVSTNADCSSPITVLEDSDGVEKDFFSNPKLGAGDIDPGTYPCVMFETSDILKFKTIGSAGAACEANTEYELEICRADGGSGQLIDGTAFTCTSGEQRIAFYVSTNSSSTGGGEGTNAFTPPTSAGDATHGINLASALTIAVGGTATFVMDGSGTVDTNGSDCDMQPPAFSFSYTED